MEKIKTNVFDELNNLLEQVKTIVKDNGGFLNTQNNDYSKDTMYAYVVNWDNVDSIEEQTIVCMRVVDDRLELGLCSNSINLTEGLVESDLTDDDWYACGTGGDSIFFAQTILSIVESIHQYVPDYEILDDINTNHFYYASVGDKSGDMVGNMEIFPTLEDAKMWVEVSVKHFLNNGVEKDDIVTEMLEYNLTDEEFNSIKNNVTAFFDNLYELPYKVIEF